MLHLLIPLRYAIVIDLKDYVCKNKINQQLYIRTRIRIFKR